MSQKSHIRPATSLDTARLCAIAAEMGTVPEPKYFEQCLALQADEKRVVLVAEEKGLAVGYIQLVWQPLYAPFRKMGIPEIQDLNVVPGARRQGIGRQLVMACEDLAGAAGKTEIGIGVGLYARFGAAQRLYVGMGYVPDGAGVCYDDAPVRGGDLRPVDDLLTLKLTKNLTKAP